MRRWWVMLLGVVVIVLGTSPHSAGGWQSRLGTTKPMVCPASGSISFMFWGDKGEKIEKHATVRLAEKECPELRINEIWDRGNYDADLAAMVRSGHAPDVFQLDAEKYVPQFAGQGLLTNLDPYIKRDKLDVASIYWPACLGEAKYRGHVWGLPRDCSNQGVLFYNKDMFDARHVKYPTDTWTYRDFAAAAQRLTGDYSLPTDPASKLRFGYAWNDDDFRINQYMWQWGGDWLTKDLKRCMLTSVPVQRAFTWWRNLRDLYHAAPTDEQMAISGDNVGGFKDQYYAMTFAGAWALNYMLKPSPATGVPPPGFRWGAVVTPRGPKNREALMDAALEVIPSTSRNKNAAWWLVRFLTEGKAGALQGAFGIGIPGAIRLSRDPAVKKEYGSLLRVFLRANRTGRGMRVVPRYGEFWEIIKRDLDPMWRNGESVWAATRHACRDVAPLLP